MKLKNFRAEKHMESINKTHQMERAESWPELPYEAWKDTCDTLHMWTQIVGKVRMELSPVVNHWWHVALYVTPRGLTTSVIPSHGGTYDVSFDFIEHTLFICNSEETTKALPLVLFGHGLLGTANTSLIPGVVTSQLSSTQSKTSSLTQAPPATSRNTVRIP